MIKLIKINWVENVLGCIICLLNFSPRPRYFKALIEEYIQVILNPPDDIFATASFLVILSGPEFHKNLKKTTTSSSWISSTEGFANERNSDTK